MLKKLYVLIPILLCLILICSAVPSVIMAEDISQNVFRLHILANSDTDYDQALKLKVRDKVLKLSDNLFNGCDTVDEAILISNYNTDLIEDTAQKVVAFYGYDYDVDVKVVKEYFNTRQYNNFTLPAGTYNSLKIIIGSGKGHNWWCVMYPSVCISGCTNDFSDSLTPDEIKMIKSNKYIVKFKTVEIYEKIKSYI